MGKMFLRSLFNHIELNKAELETNFEKRIPLQFHISRSMNFKWKKKRIKGLIQNHNNWGWKW
jgi:hypothetical protein